MFPHRYTLPSVSVYTHVFRFHAYTLRLRVLRFCLGLYLPHHFLPPARLPYTTPRSTPLRISHAHYTSSARFGYVCSLVYSRFFPGLPPKFTPRTPRRWIYTHTRAFSTFAFYRTRTPSVLHTHHTRFPSRFALRLPVTHARTDSRYLSLPLSVLPALDTLKLCGFCGYLRVAFAVAVTYGSSRSPPCGLRVSPTASFSFALHADCRLWFGCTCHLRTRLRFAAPHAPYFVRFCIFAVHTGFAALSGALLLTPRSFLPLHHWDGLFTAAHLLYHGGLLVAVCYRTHRHTTLFAARFTLHTSRTYWTALFAHSPPSLGLAPHAGPYNAVTSPRWVCRLVSSFHAFGFTTSFTLVPFRTRHAYRRFGSPHCANCTHTVSRLPLPGFSRTAHLYYTRTRARDSFACVLHFAHVHTRFGLTFLPRCLLCRLPLRLLAVPRFLWHVCYIHCLRFRSRVHCATRLPRLPRLSFPSHGFGPLRTRSAYFLFYTTYHHVFVCISFTAVHAFTFAVDFVHTHCYHAGFFGLPRVYLQFHACSLVTAVAGSASRLRFRCLLSYQHFVYTTATFSTTARCLHVTVSVLHRFHAAPTRLLPFSFATFRTFTTPVSRFTTRTAFRVCSFTVSLALPATAYPFSRGFVWTPGLRAYSRHVLGCGYTGPHSFFRLPARSPLVAHTPLHLPYPPVCHFFPFLTGSSFTVLRLLFFKFRTLPPSRGCWTFYRFSSNIRPLHTGSIVLWVRIYAHVPVAASRAHRAWMPFLSLVLVYSHLLLVACILSCYY